MGGADLTPQRFAACAAELARITELVLGAPADTFAFLRAPDPA